MPLALCLIHRYRANLHRSLSQKQHQPLRKQRLTHSLICLVTLPLDLKPQPPPQPQPQLQLQPRLQPQQVCSRATLPHADLWHLLLLLVWMLPCMTGIHMFLSVL